MKRIYCIHNLILKQFLSLPVSFYIISLLFIVPPCTAAWLGLLIAFSQATIDHFIVYRSWTIMGQIDREIEIDGWDIRVGLWEIIF